MCYPKAFFLTEKEKSESISYASPLISTGRRGWGTDIYYSVPTVMSPVRCFWGSRRKRKRKKLKRSRAVLWHVPGSHRPHPPNEGLCTSRRVNTAFTPHLHTIYTAFTPQQSAPVIYRGEDYQTRTPYLSFLYWLGVGEVTAAGVVFICS